MMSAASYGSLSSGSSESAGLSQSLASKLRQRLATVGSIEFSQTWKQKVTPAGRLYWEHIPSAPRTGDKDCSGWPTPTDDDANNVTRASGEFQSLPRTAQLASWPTPSSQGSAGETSEDLELRGEKFVNTKTGRVLQTNLATTVKMLVPASPWATPTIRDHKDGSNVTWVPENCLLGRQVHGAITLSSPCATEKRGALNPRFSLWLQGYPAEWASCGERAMQSFLKRRPSSSKPSSK